VVGEHHEGLLALDEPGGLPMAEPLGHLGEGEAEAAEVVQGEGEGMITCPLGLELAPGYTGLPDDRLESTNSKS
jgi:hypothetical protein